MRACDRGEHRDYHLTLQGILTYTVAGTYIFKVPKNISRMKVQLWGAGGGSGYFLGRRGGPGGGGAFVEAIIDVEPFTVLELIVGSGGRAGVKGTELSAVDIHEQRRRMALRREKEIHLPKGAKLEFDEDEENAMVVESACGVTLGGTPGGMSCLMLIIFRCNVSISRWRGLWRRRRLGEWRRRRLFDHLETHQQRQPGAARGWRWRGRRIAGRLARMRSGRDFARDAAGPYQWRQRHCR
jgi:hypothetical protein